VIIIPTHAIRAPVRRKAAPAFNAAKLDENEICLVNGNGPLFEELNVSEATEIHVEIAHHDTPFYYNPNRTNLTWDTIHRKGYTQTALPALKNRRVSRKRIGDACLAGTLSEDL
jgi:hypothetical protein